MTKEELDVLYQDIIDANEFSKKIKVLKEEYKQNNNSYAYELLNNVVNTCKNRILDNINDLSFYILHWCNGISSELDAEICDFCIQYCNNYNEDNLTQFYGVAAYTAFLISKDRNWYFKYVKAFCNTQVFTDENDHIKSTLKNVSDDNFKIILNILIEGLNGVRQKEIQLLLKQLINDSIKPRVIIDALLAKGISLSNYLESYLDYNYRYDYDLIEVLLKNEDDNILKVLKDYTWSKYNLDHSNLLFLNAITEYLNDRLEFPQFMQKLFDNYKEFKESGSYSKLSSLNIKNLNKLINRIEEIKIRGYSNTDILLDESEMPELSNMLKHEIDNIYKKIVNMTSYKIAIEDLKDINIKFSYEEKKENHSGVDINEVIIQAKKVYDIMSHVCQECEKDCCLKGWFRDLLEQFLENPTIDNARAILEVFLECKNSCINKELRNEINKLRNLIMSLPYILTIYGEYDNKNNCIILYLKNIYNDNPNDYGKFLLYTFAHELFHAYHAICVELNGESWEDSSDDANIVIESLASYFENEFSDRYANLVKEWAKYTIDSWPYAGAKHFTPYDNSSYPIRYPNYVLFKYVFMESLKSLSKACEMIRFGEKMEFEDF